jgi:uncharacterized protein with von Willebrand factor type A (vWA) domain
MAKEQERKYLEEFERSAIFEDANNLIKRLEGLNKIYDKLSPDQRSEIHDLIQELLAELEGLEGLEELEGLTLA